MHYAIIDKSGLFVCIQGDQKWFQGDCTGWAICTPDLNWVTEVSNSLPFESEVVTMIKDTDHTFSRKQGD